MIELPSLKSVIKRFDLEPKKNLGQNFLLDQIITDKIVNVSRMKPGDDVLEIGPGPGGLTRSILFKNPKKLIAIEQDSRCILALEELKEIYPQLEIINGDALEGCDLALTKPKIIANLPYNIGTALLLKWFKKIDFWDSMTLMFQKEVAERIAASPGCKSYGRLSVISQLLCDTELHFEIAPELFFPPPKVTSAVISLYPKPVQQSSEVIEAVQLVCRILFNQRRKMLRSTLKQLHQDVEMLVNKTDITLTQRPEELSVNQFVQIAKNFIILTSKH